MPLFTETSLKYAQMETAFLDKLGDASRCVTSGITTPAIRRARLRELIISLDVADAVMWVRKDGATETYRQCWERFYQIPFDGVAEGVPPKLHTAA